MRHLLALGICCLLAGSAAARGGGGHGGGGGGMGGGGMRGGMGGGGMRGGMGGMRGGGFRGGGFRGNGFRNFGFRNFGFRGYYGGYSPYWGWGYGGYGWPYGDWGYDSSYGSDYYPNYPYDYSTPYGSAASQPNVTVIYPPQTPPPPTTVYVERATPSMHEYDESGREIYPSSADRSDADGSPIYLIAFKDHIIRAASSYRVEGNTLHYVTLENQPRTVSLETVDRNFTLQLNWERHVPFQLP